MGLFFYPAVFFAQEDNGEAPRLVEDEFYKGKVIAVEKEEIQDEFGAPLFIQYLSVEVTSGPDIGKRLSLPYEVHENNIEARKLLPCRRLVIGKQIPIDGEPLFYVSDVYRLNAVWWIVGVFFLLTVYFARWQGIRAFLGLAISFFLLFFVIVEKIVGGSSPVLASMVGVLLIATISLYIAHGFRMRTSIAFVSTLITIGLSFLFATLFVRASHLFGFGTEEAFFLQFAPIEHIDLRGILLAGIMLGVLGVLDDVTTAQAATVEEIHRANTSLGFTELYQRGLSVGREHIVSLVNTLALAYTGASFPLLLLFYIYERPLWVTLNSEIILEEVIRILVGSITLIFAVPITTMLAAWWYHARPSFESRNP